MNSQISKKLAPFGLTHTSYARGHLRHIFRDKGKTSLEKLRESKSAAEIIKSAERANMRRSIGIISGGTTLSAWRTCWNGEK